MRLHVRKSQGARGGLRRLRELDASLGAGPPVEGFLGEHQRELGLEPCLPRCVSLGGRAVQRRLEERARRPEAAPHHLRPGETHRGGDPRAPGLRDPGRRREDLWGGGRRRRRMGTGGEEKEREDCPAHRTGTLLGWRLQFQ